MGIRRSSLEGRGVGVGGDGVGEEDGGKEERKEGNMYCE